MIDTALTDAHVHFWDLQRLSYPWLAQVPAINRDFVLEDYRQATEGLDVQAMVFVQAECDPSQHLDELRWIRELADREPRLKGIVPWAPIESGDAVEEELAAMAQDPRVKGVRRIIQFVAETDPDLCIRPDFVRGAQLLGQHGLHFEFTLAPSNFPNAIKLVEQCPDTAFILDHIGNPNIAAGEWEPWASGLRAFANSGPHSCKLSNLVCNANLDTWTVEDLKPYADHVLDCFGPDRVIWASDWPHALRASEYKRWLDAADQLTSHLSNQDRQNIFHQNAQTFYRLG